MPVSFSVATHPANPVRLSPDVQEGLTGEGILSEACEDPYKKAETVLQFALVGTEGSGRDFTTKNPRIVPKHNGFVNTLLRASFVAHEGKQKLAIVVEGTRDTVDFGQMLCQMVDLIEKNVVDPTMRGWALPAFTTTTPNDVTVSAVLLMATCKAYFSYAFGFITCGIPRVTLEGERSDWVDILGRLEKLKKYGIETIAWYHLLHPVLTRFVAAFDAPESEENLEFWGKVAHYKRGGSGSSFYSGWINAFNVFSKEGKWLGHVLDTSIESDDAPESLSAEVFWATYANRMNLVLDSTPYHRLDSMCVPPGYAEVDVTLDHYGDKFDCVMVAGLIGMGVSSSGDESLSAAGEDDMVRPIPGWWMFTKKEDADAVAEAP
ncbi:hypothetical protein DFH07DRAFT_869373 [Mycena maculata]|uniref:Uncharacterized protein n=1 Tax=Mycena maculata TaxID=230809 RepID=A0AAD7N653_9AGAR|nr:hypothetical protein DFH07DRAFT_869373 [Mycena maculata]